MRKKVFGRKFSRERDTRRALFRSLVKAFLINGKMSTTKAKAKAVQPDIEKLVSLAKGNAINNIRSVYSYLGNDRNAVGLFKQITKSFENKKSGFTRIVNLPRRSGDNAEMVRLEWTEKVETISKVKPVGKKAKKGKDTETTEETKAPKKKTLKERLTSLRKKK